MRILTFHKQNKPNYIPVQPNEVIKLGLQYEKYLGWLGAKSEQKIHFIEFCPIELFF